MHIIVIIKSHPAAVSPGIVRATRRSVLGVVLDLASDEHEDDVLPKALRLSSLKLVKVSHSYYSAVRIVGSVIYAQFEDPP